MCVDVGDLLKTLHKNYDVLGEREGIRHMQMIEWFWLGIYNMES